MFESVSTIEQDARDLLRQYLDFVRGSANAVLKRGNRGPNIAELNGLEHSLSEFERIATQLTRDPQFSSLPAAMQRDLQAIAEEVPLARTNVKAKADPDALFAKQRPDRKRELMTHVTIDQADGDDIMSTLDFSKRKARKGTMVIEEPPDELPRDEASGGTGVYPRQKRTRTEVDSDEGAK